LRSETQQLLRWSGCSERVPPSGVRRSRTIGSLSPPVKWAQVTSGKSVHGRTLAPGDCLGVHRLGVRPAARREPPGQHYLLVGQAPADTVAPIVGAGPVGICRAVRGERPTTSAVSPTSAMTAAVRAVLNPTFWARALHIVSFQPLASTVAATLAVSGTQRPPELNRRENHAPSGSGSGSGSSCSTTIAA
jgi:hypothetical protein